MKYFEWKWGLLISAANFSWLVLAWAIGWHGRGLGFIQLSMSLSILVSLACFALALRERTRREPETTFTEGIKAGSLMAMISALFISLGWVVYLKWINPSWTDYLVGEMLEHYRSLNLAEDKLAEISEGLQSTYGFNSSVIQAGIGALLQGIMFSALIMGVLRYLAKR